MSSILQVRSLDSAEVRECFAIARQDSHKKAYMFTDKRAQNYLQFHALYDEDNLVAFCGVYRFSDTLARVSDRMFHTKEYRTPGLGISTRYWTDYFKDVQTAWCIDNGYIPFHSCEGVKRRAAFKQIVDRNPDYTLLPDMYQTCCKDEPQCWQSISILKGHENAMTLPRRTVEDVLQAFKR